MLVALDLFPFVLKQLRRWLTGLLHQLSATTSLIPWGCDVCLSRRSDVSHIGRRCERRMREESSGSFELWVPKERVVVAESAVFPGMRFPAVGITAPVRVECSRLACLQPFNHNSECF